MLGLLLRLLSVEVVLFVVGLMVLPRPQVLVMALYVAALYLIADKLREPQPRARITGWLQRRFAGLPLWHRPLVPWIAAVLCTLPMLLARPYAERLLWESGNFGEPPYNRYVVLKRLSDTAMLVEFGVSRHPTDGLEVQVRLEPGHIKALDWVGLAGDLSIPDDPNARKLPPLSTLVWPNGSFHVRNDGVNITPETSLFVYLETSAPIGRIDCMFNDGRDTAKRMCGEDIDVVEVASQDMSSLDAARRGR